MSIRFVIFMWSEKILYVDVSDDLSRSQVWIDCAYHIPNVVGTVKKKKQECGTFLYFFCWCFHFFVNVNLGLN